MSKRFTILMLLMALFVPWAANAQQTVTIGEGTSKQYTLPTNMYFNYSLTQQIYTAEEIGMSGTISSIAFDYTYTASFNMTGVRVYMMNVDKELFTDENDIIALTNATKVFEGTFSASGAGWVTITLDTPFQYDDDSNLLLCCFDPTSGNGGGSNWKFNTTRSTQEYPAIAWYSDDYIPSLDNLTSYSGSKSKYKYRNNIQLVITPNNCQKPSTLEVNGSTLSWTGGSGSYNVEYKKTSETNWTRAYTNLASTTCTLTLDPNTDYEARVQSACSGDETSVWRTISFTTPCGIVTIDATHSWSEGFESYNDGTSTSSGAAVTDIRCWERVQINSTTNSPFVYRNYEYAASTGSASLELKTSSGTPVMVALPEFTEAIENLNVAFNYNCTSTTYTYTAELGYISDVANASTFVKLFDIPKPVTRSTGHSSYSQDLYEASAAANAPEGSRVAIKFATTSTGSPSWNLDDFVVSYVSPCRKPSGLTVVANSVTTHNATLTWDAEAGATFQWTIDGTWNETQNNTVELTGLTPEHNYTFTLRKKCSNTEFSNEVSVSFTTTIACPAPTNLTVSNITGHTATASWTGSSDSYIVKYRTAAYMNGVEESFNSTSVPSGWEMYTGLLNNGTATMVSVTYGWTFGTGNGVFDSHARVNIYSTYQRWLVMPAFTVPANNNLTFDLALTAWSGDNVPAPATTGTDDKFIVLISTDNMSTWTTLREWNNSGSSYVYNNIAHTATGENVSINLSAYAGRNVRIAFYGESTVANADNNLHIDNVSVGFPVPAGEWQTITVNEPTATITGMAPETLYEVIVQSNCGDDGVSSELGPVAFTTGVACTPPTNLHTTDVTAHEAMLHWDGYAESYNVSYYKTFFFDSFEEDLSQWTVYHEGDPESFEWGIENPHDNSADLNAHSGYYAAVAYSDYDIHADSWLVTPQIQFPNQTTLKFWIMRSTYDDAQDEYEVRLSTTGNAISDFTTVLKEKEAANSYWTEVSIDLSEYDGQQCYIAIRHDFTNGFFIMVDDFGIFGWSEDIVTTADSLLIEDLLPETEYKWHVQANCGEEDGLSQWSDINNFTTLRTCPVPIGLNASNETAHGATLDWTGLSENYQIWVGELESAYSNYNFEDNRISDDFTNSTSYPWTVTTNDKHGGTYSVKSGGAGVASVNSELTLEITVENEATLSFWARISSESTYDKGYFSIDGSNRINGISGNGSWINYTYTLEAGSHTLRWYYTKDTSVNSNDDCFYVDDITIGSDVISSEMTYTVTEEPFILDDAQHIHPETSYMVKVKGICGDEETDFCEPITFTTTVTCLPIDSLSFTNLTATSVNLNWVLLDETQTAWQICLNGDEDNLIAANTNEGFLLDGLEPETEYTVKVRAFCDENDQSRWSNTITFTTPISCYAVNSLSYDNLTAFSVNLSWVLQDETQTAWQICLNGDEENLIAANTNEGFLLDGFTPNVEYTVKVRAYCGENDYSRWSSSITFTTPEVCATPTDLAVANITAVSTDLSWIGREDVESYTVRYRTVEGMVTHFKEDFSDNIDSWTMVDCVTGTGLRSGAFAFFRVTDASNPNPHQYLISPELTSYITSNSVLEFKYRAYASNQAETFMVGVSTTNNEVDSFSWSDPITVATNVYQTYHANLPAGTKYIAIQCTSYRKYYLFIDDITIGHEAIGGQWMTETTAETEAQLINLDGGTQYEVQVRSDCNPDGWCDLATFETELDGTKVFVAEGNWNTANNWMPEGAPTLDSKVIIRADATIPNGCVAEANRILFEGTSLTIENGGQLKVNSDISATIKKNIEGYGTNNAQTNNGFNLIAMPATTAVTTANAGLITAQSNYDLYTWNRTATDEEWHYNHSGLSMANGTGYLYANEGDVEMNITATLQRSSLPITMTPAYDEEHGGWNLYGNPFPCEAYLSSNDDVTFYRLIGSDFVPVTGAIAPMEGFFVKATATGQTFTISRETPAK